MTQIITKNQSENTTAFESPRQRARLGTAEREMQILQAELSVRTANDAVGLVRQLQAQVAALSASPANGRASAFTPPMDSSPPQATLGKIRDFATKVATLNGTITSMEGQLMSLYADRERLEREIGAGEVEDVIAVFRAQQSTVNSMEAQLSQLYADREQLDSALGRSEPEEVVSLFQRVARLVQGVQRELRSVTGSS